MILSEQDREALRAHWLGEPLPARLERLLSHMPRSGTQRERHLAARDYLASLSAEAVLRTRRLVLAYSAAAVGLLGELIQGENKDLARRAAVDLMRLYREFRDEEREERAADNGAAERLLAESLSDAQAETLLGILADVGASVGWAQDNCGGGDGDERDSAEDADGKTDDAETDR